MDPFELEIKRRLARRAPSEGFTARLMLRVHEQGGKASGGVVEMPLRRPQRWRRWAAVGAVAASLTVGMLVEQGRRAEKRSAQQAETDLVEALFFAGAKVQQARDRAWGENSGGEQK